MKSLGVKTLLAMIALGIGVAAYAQQSGRDLDKIVLATDNATVQVDTANQTTKTPKTPFVDFTYDGSALTVYLADEQGSFQDGDWSLINADSAVMTLDPNIIANTFYTNGLINSDLAGKDYTITVRVNSETNGPNGATQTFFDEFDQYRSDITVSYHMNGQDYTVSFRSPNSATGHVFDWQQPIPFHNFYSLDNINNPVEFQDAMLNLGDLFDSESDTMDVKTDQRNANNANWAEVELLLSTLSQNAGTTLEPYPTVVSTEMIDYTKKSSTTSIVPGENPFKYGSSGTGGLDFDPPIGFDQVIDTSSTWAHTYTVPVPDANTMPAVSVTGLSDNMSVDSVYVVPTEDPLLYTVHLVLQGGNDVSEENFEVSFVGIPVGTPELSIEDLALKYYPNPFANNINLSYNLDDNYDMKVRIVNAFGQIVKTIDMGTQGKGKHEFSWSPDDTTLPDGMYIFRIDGVNNKGRNFRETIKINKQ